MDFVIEQVDVVYGSVLGYALLSHNQVTASKSTTV